jgi:tripartite-type tricarboxylate transporter receptor subunit TctC
MAGEGNQMTITRRDFMAGAMALAGTGVAQAQDWNPANLRIIVPFAAGGSVDALGRLAVEGLKQGRSGAYVVENRTGASGSIGANGVAKATPDGSTWLLTFDIHAVLPSLIPSLPYNNETDLVPVTLIGTSPMVFVTGRNSPFQTFEQMVTHGKSKGMLNYGSGSAGTLGHLTMTMMAQKAGVPMTHVSYRGGTPALNDTIAGHIDGFIGSSAIVAQHIAAGTVRPILQTGGARISMLADVPTAKEIGFPDIDGEAWWAVFGTGGTPKTIVDEFHKQLAAVFRQPANEKLLRESLHIKLVLSQPEQFRAFFEKEVKLWGSVVREHKITAS